MCEIRTMVCLGTDDWGRPVYKCLENGYLWKDITMGSPMPKLYSCDSFDGEPESPIRGGLVVCFLKEEE